MAKVTLFALLLCVLAVSAKHSSPGPANSMQAMAPGGDPPPPCPIKVCRLAEK